MSGHHVHIPQNGYFEPRNKLPAIMNTAGKKGSLKVLNMILTKLPGEKKQQHQKKKRR